MDQVAAATALARRDPVVRGLRRRYGPPEFPAPARPALRFAALAESIVFQQLHGRAAATIHGRLVARLGGRVTPQAVLATPIEDLRACGLSASKAAAIVDLADHAASGRLGLSTVARRSDDDVVAHLTQVRGVGVWTAEMFLMFTLGRLDVWPVGDYGVRNGYARAWGLDRTPTAKELAPMGDAFRPYRSVAAWYCWRVMDVG